MTGAGRFMLALATAALLSACAARRPVQATPQGLSEQGQRELARGRTGPELAPPPGLDPQRVTPRDDDRSAMELEQALASLAPAEAPQQAEVSEDDRREGLKRYAAGRLLLRDGDARGAVRELASATAIDPTAGEAWILRGEAELAAGQRAAGSRSLGRGVSLGAGEAVHRELLAREAIERREYEQAAGLLADARGMDPAAEAPELAMVIDAQLGVALERLGYDTAARRLLLDVTPALAEAAPAGRFAPLVASAMRQRARYWTLIGDLSCRLGDYAGAFEAYRQASAAPGADRAALAGARIYAALRAGAPSHAAAIALAAVDEAGLVDGAGAATLSYVAEADGRAGESLRRALAARVAEAPADHPARVNLAVALAALQPAAEARRTLLAAHASSPQNPELIRAVARSVSDIPAGEAAGVGAQMVRATPMRSAVVALAVARAHPETDGLIHSALAAGDAASRLLAARLLALAGRPQEGLAALGAARDPALAPAILAARAQLAADSGAWPEAHGAIEALRGTTGAEGAWALALALAAAQRYTEALDTLAPVIEGGPPEGALVDGAWLAMGLGERQLALRWLERALEEDPRNEAAHELRIRLLTSRAGGEEAQRQASDAVAELRAAMPGSDLLELMEIGALVMRGRYHEAQGLVFRLAEDPLRADEALRAGVEGIWSQRPPRGPDRELIEQARQWLAERAQQRPQSPATARALARTLVALDRGEEAAEALKEAIERYPWPELSLALEGILRGELNRAEEADQLALERLQRGPAGIDEVLALAALRARRGELAEAAAAVAQVPAGVQLTDDQTRLLVEAARLAGVAAEQAGGSDANEAFARAAAIFDEAGRLGAETPVEFHEARVLMLCAWPQATPQRIAGAVREASDRLGAEAAAVLARMAQAMEEQGRAADALAVFSALAESDKPLPEGALLTWLLTVDRAGDAADARRLIEVGLRHGQLCSLMLQQEPATPVEVSQLDCALALIGELAQRWQLRQRHDDLVGLFRYAYELRPDDPGSANDLGYTLLEARQDLDEAARLIERAYREEPDNGAVLDSIGWLRYRQGIFEDELDEAGRVVREGAVTLLQRASERRRSPTIHDHYGDALWRIGRPAAARLAWQTARGLAARDEQTQAQAQEISRKLRAALRGEEPQIAEVYEEFGRRDSEAGGAGS